MSNSAWLTRRRTKRPGAAALLLVGLAFVACRDDGSLVTGVDFLVPDADIIGGGTGCEDSYSWVEQQHVDADSTELVSPAVCWEYQDSATVSVHIKYAFTPTTPHPGWHTLRLFHLDHHCLVPEAGAPFEVLDSVLTLADSIGTGSPQDPLIQHSLSSNAVTLPASPDCAFVVLHESDNDPRGSSDDHAYVRLLTKLDRPETLSGTFDGSSVDLTWQNTQLVQTEIGRSPSFGGPVVVDSGVAGYADSSWSYGAAHTYRVRHRNTPEGSAKTRVSDWSDPVTVDIPDSLTAYIFGDTIVPPDEPCSYTAVREGGTPQYSYLWSGDAEGTTQIIWQSFPLRAKPYVLNVTVTDSLQWEAHATAYVTVSGSAPTCHLAPGGATR